MALGTQIVPCSQLNGDSPPNDGAAVWMLGSVGTGDEGAGAGGGEGAEAAGRTWLACPGPALGELAPEGLEAGWLDWPGLWPVGTAADTLGPRPLAVPVGWAI